MVLRCKECGEIVEIHNQQDEVKIEVVETGERAWFSAGVTAPMCPDCQAWSWELCGDGDEEGAA